MPKEQVNPETKDGKGANRLLAGKYTDDAALEKGYLEQQRETQKVIQSNRNLEDQIRNLQAINEGLQQPKPELDNEAMSAAGLDPGKFNEYLEAAAASAAAETVERLLTPLAKTAEASALLDMDQTRFLHGDPNLEATYTRLVTSDPTGAAELVKARFELEQLRNTEARLEAGDAQVRESQAASRTDAYVPQGSGRQQAEGDSTEDEARLDKLGKLAEYGRESGDTMPLIRERLLGGKDPIEPWMPGEPPPASLMRKRE